jgi:hypothetical protein
MKKMKLLFWLVVLTPILLTATARADENGYDAARHRTSITGAWQVEVTVRFDSADCTASPPVPFGPNPFPALYSFHEGGTVSETGSRSPPASRSPGHGVWKRTARNIFDVRNTFQGFDPNGLLAANADIRSSVQLSEDGSTFAGVSQLTFTDTSGNANRFCATLDGVRFTL